MTDGGLAQLKVRVLHHLREHPRGLTQYDIARALRLMSMPNTGVSRVGRALKALEADGEAQHKTEPRDETDTRPVTRWRPT